MRSLYVVKHRFHSICISEVSQVHTSTVLATKKVHLIGWEKSPSFETTNSPLARIQTYSNHLKKIDREIS
jgi:hypothetical protein